MSHPEAQNSGFENLAGTVLAGRYRLEEMIGDGAMGAVFRAKQLTLNRDVAVKILHPELIQNAEITKRFEREAQSIAKLEHPNIVQVLEYGSTDSGENFIVMQLLEGQELRLLLGEPVNPRKAVERTIHILRGLEHAHSHQIIHRDLKPENVFVTRDHEGKESLKLVDFGISKINRPDSVHETVTRAGMIFGTPLYMSPEQATGSEIDARTDIYSTGIMLFEMLTGDPPFESDDPVKLIRMQVSVPPPLLPEHIHPMLAAVVAKMLEKDRDERMVDATEARIALEAILNDLVAGESSPDLTSYTSAHRNNSIRTPIPGVSGTVLSNPATTTSVIQTILPQPGSKYRVPVITAGVLVALSLAFAVGLNAQDKTANAASTNGQQGSASAEGEAEVTLRPKVLVEPNKLAEIDKLISARNGIQALELIKPLRDAYPEDATLLWREGQALALRKAKRSTALGRYAEAIDRDATLLDNADFYAELYDLFDDRRLREAALDLALQKLGQYGHKFLLRLVNEENPDRALKYGNRHRALSELGKYPDTNRLVNHQLNLARDVWQARFSSSPCPNFGNALIQIEDLTDSEDIKYFIVSLENAKIPKAKESSDEAGCHPLEGQLNRTRAKLSAQLTQLEGTTATGTTNQGVGVAENQVVAENKASKKTGQRTRSSKRKSHSKSRANKKPAKKEKIGDRIRKGIDNVFN